LSIGLRAVARLQELYEQNPGLFSKTHLLYPRIETLKRYTSLSEIIEIFWFEHKNRETGSWTGHRDINMVMLATSLSPDGYLIL
jgi:hypothetical protein